MASLAVVASSAGAAFQAVKDVAFPVSTALFFLYPVIILVWNIAEGTAAQRQKNAASPDRLDVFDCSAKVGFQEPLKSASTSSLVKAGRAATAARRRRSALAFGVALLAAVSASLVLLGQALGFAHTGHQGAPRQVAGSLRPRPMPDDRTTDLPAEGHVGASRPLFTATSAGALAAVFGAAVALAAGRRRSGGAAAAGEVPKGSTRAPRPAVQAATVVACERPVEVEDPVVQSVTIPRFVPPAPAGISLWHDVDLHVKDWLDEDTGLFHYVNEMPKGSLQKFEVQPDEPENAISEDQKGSAALAAFGRPVPFNYGCLPQTFRDPTQVDELYNAPGDDDPLDILDLCRGSAGVGQVVRCRPLGAVCLIDEGQADWKIVAVNVDDNDPLAQAQTIDDIERLAPGRLAECLQWLDDLKSRGGKAQATLHRELHDVQRAIGLIEKDHAAWKRLVNEAGVTGRSRGHWIREAKAVPRYTAPEPTGKSLWHDVELHVSDLMGKDDGLVRYVNEMPMGSLQKFEVQPDEVMNAIKEDPKGSSRLANFGQPVPFNYGCLPQTFRDPRELDATYGAPGDNDPLDILDLSQSTVGVGEVVRCRPLGAVCLIDEGQADWKVLAVNVDDGGPLADARSIEDVERIMPGRVAECLKWMDDFKQSDGGDQAKLHFEIHDAKSAMALIGRDHGAWRRLVESADSDGLALGHWVRPAHSAPVPVVLPLPVPRYSAPMPTEKSLWHDVQLMASENEGGELVNYVNEMPRGSLQKFEVQPAVPGNAIEEDPKGSSRLAAFGQPVPFNYGCLPQTFRDPNQLDDKYNAPGDDDPLDILDLSESTSGVGEVVRCRPLGAVCLIDEGQADWKVLAVNVDDGGPLADARSIEDVERIMPGRVAECLKWMDDFKQSSGKGEAKLHFEIHDAQQAMSLIQKDHSSWQRLVESAGSDGTAAGHWVRKAVRPFSLPFMSVLVPPVVPRYVAPVPTGKSLWHDVELRAKTGLDADSGIFRYVNEMPLGSLQKFEVQPHVPQNAISEDPKGSLRLAAFGQPVPFNYGCLPQTFRDPQEFDEQYNAPGDDDPLDILDLGRKSVGVGEIVNCRPLGAVCLIDEGQADWKILAVSIDDGGPLAEAQSIEDVELIMPGRVAECLKWMDDFKQSSGNDEAKLHFEIHGRERALQLIEKDHSAWGRLVQAAGEDGLAHGHWIRSAKEERAPQEVTVLPSVPRYEAPVFPGTSLWHDVDLHVRTWLNESTDLVRYVNEMPRGCLQKFEVQPGIPENAIAEDPKGSSRLAAFGRPVPFNYGCLPQTFRDPNQVDDLYNAPGDDDPLDILDLSMTTVPVGHIVQCRPLGAVCLIDEGQADWKILAVNVDEKGPLAAARSIDDVERIMPGRIAECLKWMDDFKQSSGDDEAKLHFEIHDADRAMRLIEQDHAAWRRLVEQASAGGEVHGHWVRAPENSPAKPKALNVDWFPSSTITGQAVRGPSVFAGMQRLATMVPVLAARSKSRARTVLDDQGCPSRGVLGRRSHW